MDFSSADNLGSNDDSYSTVTTEEEGTFLPGTILQISGRTWPQRMVKTDSSKRFPLSFNKFIYYLLYINI